MPDVRRNRSDAIVELMAMPAAEHDETWLKEALQQAVMLELATLPPYLCGLWSIREADRGPGVFEALHAIVFDEMSHMGLACNMLTTIGGMPRIADADLVPTYPGPLPGGVQPGLSVSLTGLSKQALDMYSRIERPDDPVVEDLDAHTSIGAFYTAILEAFRSRPELIKGTRQLERNMSSHGEGNDIVALTSLGDVETALKVIKEQGEGTAASPDNPFPGDTGEPAHFYAFREMFHGRRLIRVSDDPPRFDFQGEEIPMPRTFPMATVPAGGWAEGGVPVSDDVREHLGAFNRRYSSLLRFLERAWRTEQPSTAAQMLNGAIGQMFQLEEPARALMETPLPGGSGQTYGPEFRFVGDEP
ncbi:ferritin-like protein [Streptomyces sp. 5-8]|uniref:Ferritin-like protein n=2 Tax=Streptomyces musisoli TaxID=2802280 RepID=A0ABS1P126_9ACTN|nr:ferritin-like protein [Streptomyces sp. SP2-10]MBL1105730.1 ferritin-like protein [Streptomyces musisoli]MBY8841618.1 ferritin-like protein [Streptomyces sp. SP2-10]